MRRFVIVLILAALALALLAGTAAAGPVRTCAPAPATMATFSPGDWGSFAEGMAANSHGTLFVSLTTWGYYDETTAEPNIGEVWKVSPGGDKILVASADLSPYGMLLGVAVDRCDRVYVAAYDMGSGMTANGVYRVADDGTLTQVVSLPVGVWPNGLAFHRGKLYISDSATGAIWRARVGTGIASPDVPWSKNPLLEPASPYGIGANGIAFLGDYLYSSVSDHGRIVRIPVGDDGVPGTVRKVYQAARLEGADGIAFDAHGDLWITVNQGTTGASPSGALYRLAPGGRLTTVADDPGWLNYPTTPVFGRSPSARCTLFVENGAYFNWADGTSPDIQALRVGIPGLPLR
jgi:sugar lactone lactonase YvrE